MAIITISRKIASFGDETAAALAKLLGYTFVTRKMIEEKLRERGIPAVSYTHLTLPTIYSV